MFFIVFVRRWATGKYQSYSVYSREVVCLTTSSSSSKLNGPLKCFNGNKNWLLKWYEDKQIVVAPGSSWSGRLAAFVDYNSASVGRNEYVLLRVDDMFVQYNLAESFNVGTREMINEVTIVKGDDIDATVKSELKAGIGAYESYTRDGMTFEVCSFETGPAKYAELRVYPEGTPSSCPPPWSPDDPPLDNIGDCSSSSPCTICQGDCDNDEQCAPGLKCFERSGTTPVPGCRGYGESSKDYCYSDDSTPLQPTPSPTPFPTTAITPFPTPFPTAPLPPSADPPLEYIGDCSSDAPCSRCQGDCDGSSHCGPGLECFQREGLEPVPGCTGTGVSGKDYCYLASAPGPSPTSSPAPPTPSSPPSNDPALEYIGDCSSSSPCGLCQGDCDGDVHCGSGLKCFQRSGTEAVPGCSGSGVSGKDYCYNDSPPTPSPPPSNDPALEYIGDCSSSSPCGLCQGDCDGDVHCGSGLKCFQRSGTESVPGCSGAGVSGKDYCYADVSSPTPAPTPLPAPLPTPAPTLSPTPLPTPLPTPSPTPPATPAPTLPPSNDPPLDYIGDCSSSSPCGLCQGDCDGDVHCASGLKCFQRSGTEAVPGCSGAGVSGKDYCYSDSPPTPSPPPSNDPALEYIGDCSSSSPCGLCQGDCDGDVHCGSGLKCFQRSGTESVPGCSGLGVSGKDYCYSDAPPTPSPPPSNDPALEYIGDCSSSSPCGLCQGDCDGDVHCGSGLKCFQRSGTESVPGCSGLGVSGKDYCYSDAPPTPSPPPSNDPALEYIGDCSSSSPCGLCQGDCDGDVHCGSGLKCFQRSGTESVPGCSGTGVSGKDYCYAEPVLEHIGDCSSSSPCGICQGDCDGDVHCGSGLKCFKRSGTESVPGCSGAGVSGKDYCYAEPALQYIGDCSSSSPCGLCQGDCDGDSHCGSGLKCFQRSGTESVPGCSGLGVSGQDYCYMESLDGGATCEDSSGTFYANARLGERGCAWLAARPRKIARYCNTAGHGALTTCPATCGQCR